MINNEARGILAPPLNSTFSTTTSSRLEDHLNKKFHLAIPRPCLLTKMKGPWYILGHASAEGSVSQSTAIQTQCIVVIVMTALLELGALARSCVPIYPSVSCRGDLLPGIILMICLLRKTATYFSPNFTLHDPEGLATRYIITDSTISGRPKVKCFCNRCGCTIFTIPTSDGLEETVIRTVLIANG